MFLVRMIYASQASPVFEPQDIKDILLGAKLNNAKCNVTGLLCFNRKFFLQCLEGSRTDVNETYRAILNDPRHQNIILLDYKEITNREFEQWNMGYVPESQLTSKINLKYSGGPCFDPFHMSAESAYQMLLELRNNVPTS
ncbi:BLUF domain-containing protein [Catenovulum sp. SM1970]|uniref:BLUF domain-containing protein n=1 Tax=Marinifaba aquimaris TaxID=2741323 RepID=UPI0015720002|nr:BLUF domain-containing protein [Marinifaba aquimaris]NTS75436.1 BLUF domain-containing protein [Marinifaba aquimaris]